MTSPSTPLERLWALVPVVVIALVAWFDHLAKERIAAVSALSSSALVLEPDATSPSGWAGGRRHQIVPGHNLTSYAAIVQAEALLHEDTWTQREFDYDNAPQGRTVRTPSGLRWWLASVATWLSPGETSGEKVAAAALRADPLLHVGLILGTTALVAWQAGWMAAAVAAILVGLGYPMLGIFYPGAPTEKGLVTVLAAGLILPWLVSLSRALAGKSAVTLAVISGIAGGTLWWISLHHGVTLTLAATAAGLLAGGLHQRQQSEQTPELPWLPWALAGALAVLALWGIDFARADLDWSDSRWRQLHPAHAATWVGLGWLARLISHGSWKRSTWGQLAGSVLLLLAVPVAMAVAGQLSYPSTGLGADLLTHFPDTVSTTTFVLWVNEHASRSAAAGVLLPPIALLGFLVWQAINGQMPPARRSAVLAASLLLLGVIAMGFTNLSWWAPAFVALAGLAATFVPTVTSARGRLSLGLGMVVVVGIGWLDLAPRMSEARAPQLTDSDRRSLTERHLAHWLSLRQDEFRSVVLAPPEVTPALHFYGGVRGLGTPYPENEDGFIAAVRIASATSPDESLALATQRELSHIVIPSWDNFLDNYAELGAARPEHSLMAMLHQWLAPRWLRPMPYRLPDDDAFADFGATVFAVTETQDNASALSRLGEYFAETGRAKFAAAVAVTLRESFPSDLSGLVAQAQIAVLQGNLPVFQETLEAILPFVEEGRDGDLEFDRRVSLANVLMLGQESELAREQVQYCMDEVDDYLLRTVSPANLHRFVLLASSFEEPFPEPALETLARRLLPLQPQQRL